jgi:hypothetical protein
MVPFTSKMYNCLLDIINLPRKQKELQECLMAFGCNCFVDILEMEDKSEELVRVLTIHGLLDEHGELTKEAARCIDPNME